MEKEAEGGNISFYGILVGIVMSILCYMVIKSVTPA